MTITDDCKEFAEDVSACSTCLLLCLLDLKMAAVNEQDDPLISKSLPCPYPDGL